MNEAPVRVEAKPVGNVEKVKPEGKRLSSKQKKALTEKTKTDPRGVLNDVSKLGEKESVDEKKVPVAAELKNKILGVVQEIGLGKDIKDLSYIARGLTGEVYKLTVLKNGEEVTVAVKIGGKEFSVSNEQLILAEIARAETDGKYKLDVDTTPYSFKGLGGDSKENISIMEYIPLSEETPIKDCTPLENFSIATQYAHYIYLLRQANLANPDQKFENIHNIGGQLRITDIGLVSNKEYALESTGQIKGVLQILSQSVSPDFSEKVIKLLLFTDRNLIPYSQYSKKNQYEIGEIIRSAEFQKGPAEIKGLILKSLNLLKQEKKIEEMVSKEGYEELLLDMVALSEVKSIKIPKALKGIKRQVIDKRVDELNRFELPPLETSNETKMSPEITKKLELEFIYKLTKGLNIGNLEYFFLDDIRKGMLYESILNFSSLNKEDTALKEGLIPNFETFIAKLQSLDDPKKIGIDDELITTQYSAMRSIILGLNGKQRSDFSSNDISLIKTKIKAIKEGGNKEELSILVTDIFQSIPNLKL